MPTITHKQLIHAPADLCFDLARSVDVHIKTTSQTNERAVGGVTEGLLEEGDTVTWEGTHFGVKQRLTAQVTCMNKPDIFVDKMLKGAFKSFTHTHQFVTETNGTLMIDTFDYQSPFGMFGMLADKLFLESYMKRLIAARAKALKRIAENTEDA